MSDDNRFTAFPNVFLTLISIVVALGIEQLLGHVSAQFSEAAGATRFLVVAQGVTMFVVVGAIWMGYATQVMLGAWEPRFQDFFAPLLILSLFYFGISAIGTSGPAWFYILALGFATAGFLQRFDYPRAIAARLKPNSPEGRRSIYCLFSLSLLTAGAFMTF